MGGRVIQIDFDGGSGQGEIGLDLDGTVCGNRASWWGDEDFVLGVCVEGNTFEIGARLLFCELGVSYIKESLEQLVPEAGPVAYVLMCCRGVCSKSQLFLESLGS